MESSIFNAILSANRKIFLLIQQISPSSLREKISINWAGDMSLQIDCLAEEIFCEYLLPFGSIVSEEKGFIGKKPYLFFIDPLDGSDNFLHSIPYYGTSVYYEKENSKISVITNLVSGDIIYRLGDSSVKRYYLFDDNWKKNIFHHETKIAFFERAYAYPSISHKLFLEGYKFRSMGAVALSLAYTSEALFFLFIGKYREVDLKAGLHLCQDAYHYYDDNIVIVSYHEHVFERLYHLFVKENYVF